MKTLLLAISLMILPLFAYGRSANVWLTTADRSSALARQSDLTFQTDTGSEPLTIVINDGTTYQQIDGFGAHFLSDDYFFNLPTSQRDAAMLQLFDSDVGIGLSFVRVGIGAHFEQKSLDDVPGDTALANFNLDIDLPINIPLLQQALQINPSLKVISVPFSPPGWMKDNGSMILGKLLPQYYGTYAQYFVKYVQGFAAHGIPVYAVTPQNEPTYGPTYYPGMVWPWQEEATFVGGHLGPAFAAAGISTKIIVGDLSGWSEWPYTNNILNNAAAKPFIAGSAFHWYDSSSPDVVQQLHANHPDKGIWETEASSGCVLGQHSPADELIIDMQRLIIGATRNWFKSIVKYPLFNWNPDTSAECWGVMWVDSGNQTAIPQTAYYSLGHASKFVRTGAYRIESNTFENNLENVAFKNPDGSIAVVVANIQGSAQTFKVKWGNESVTYSLPGRSVVTLTWSGGTVVPPPPPPPPPPATTETLPIFINAGGNNLIDTQGSNWDADRAFTGGTSITTANSVTGTDIAQLYQSERYGNFQYNFNVPNGRYAVTLKFAEIYWTAVGQRVFDVTLNGTKVLANYDIVEEAGPLTATDHIYEVDVTNEVISLQFLTLVDNAKVSGIAIESVVVTEPPPPPPDENPNPSPSPQPQDPPPQANPPSADNQTPTSTDVQLEFTGCMANPTSGIGWVLVVARFFARRSRRQN